MKKFLAILLCMALVLSFGACSSSKKSDSDDSKGPITLTDDKVDDLFEFETTYDMEYGIFNDYYAIVRIKIRPVAGYIPDNVAFVVNMYTDEDSFEFNSDNSQKFGYFAIYDEYEKDGEIYRGLCQKRVEFDSEEPVEVTFVVSSDGIYAHDGNCIFKYDCAEGIMAWKY